MKKIVVKILPQRPGKIKFSEKKNLLLKAWKKYLIEYNTRIPRKVLLFSLLLGGETKSILTKTNMIQY